MKLPLSLLILAKNEEKTLPLSIGPLSNYVQEIIVFDTGSTDRSKKIARSYGAKVVATVLNKKDWSETRNRLIEAAAQPWILLFDADFRIATTDVAKLEPLIKHPQVEAYQFPIRNYSNSTGLLQDWQPCCGEYPLEEGISKAYGYYVFYKTVLFQNRPGIRTRFQIHDIVDPSLKEHNLRIEKTNIPIHHFEFFKGLDRHHQKHRSYIRLERKTVKQWPKHPQAYVNLIADLILTQKNLSEAEQLALKLTKLDSSQMKSWMLRAIIKMEQNKLVLAERYLKKAVSLKKTADNLCLLGWVYLRKENLKFAKHFFQKSIKIKPSNPVALNLMGVLNQKFGDYTSALRYFEKASKIHPAYSEAYSNQGIIYERLGQSANAKRCYERVNYIKNGTQRERKA